MNDLLLLAQADQSDDAQNPAATENQTQNGTKQDSAAKTDSPKDEPKGSPWDLLVPMLLMFVVVYFFMFRGPKKKQQQHKQMLDNLKKGDRIRTIGGILANVVEVRENEVVIKIDETNNTKMRITRGAIGEIIVEEATEKK